jgi:signal transduction histidine kinase
MRWFRIPRSVSGKVIFCILLSLVICNLVAVILYTQISRSEEHIANTDEVMNLLLGALYLFDKSPETEWLHIAKITQTPELRIQLTEKASYPRIVEHDTVAYLRDLVDKAIKETRFSIRLKKGHWLNVKYTPHSDKELLPLFILASSTVVTLSLLFSAWTLFRFTKPLQKFKRAAEQLGVELRAEPVIEYGPSIVRDTAFAMNQMQKRISSLLEDRNLMLAAISHDLRTPITRMKLRAQFISDPDHYEETLHDLDEMETMITQILMYTKDARHNEAKKNIDLVALLLSICDERCEQGYDVECHTDLKRATFKGDPMALKRTFNNLLNNATKYAKHVSVRIQQKEKHWMIVIEDDGPGIPEEHLGKVFAAFYRIDSARSSSTGGSGLGLAIAQDVIRAHAGSIQLENRKEGGLRVVVIF